jgi:hypothetical protein
MIKYIIDGDLLKFSDEGIFDVIAHCCNCFCNFACWYCIQNKNKYQAYVADCKTASGDGNKLIISSILKQSITNRCKHICNNLVMEIDDMAV